MIGPVPEIHAIVKRLAFSPCLLSVQATDKGIISAFVECCQPNTSSFHLFVGEILINLDDVSQLLNIPTVGKFFNIPSYMKMDATHILHEFLGVPYEFAMLEMEKIL